MNSKRRPKGSRRKLRIPGNFEEVISDILNVTRAPKTSPRYLPTVNSNAGSQRER